MAERDGDGLDSEDLLRAARDGLASYEPPGGGGEPDAAADRLAKVGASDDETPEVTAGNVTDAAESWDTGDVAAEHFSPNVTTGPILPESRPVSTPWWQQKWLRVAGIAVAVALTLWRSDLFGQPSEEEFLDDMAANMQEMGVSAASCDCVEENLKEHGDVADLVVAFEELDDESLGSGVMLSELSPESQGAMITLFGHFEECLSPEELELATAPPEGAPMAVGSDRGLDLLHDGCVAGSLADCDMLFMFSQPGSEYQAVAETCGGRSEPIDFQTTYCMRHHEDLTELNGLEVQCEAGFFPACDLLFGIMAVGSPEEAFGATCGERRASTSTMLCTLAYGLGSRTGATTVDGPFLSTLEIGRDPWVFADAECDGVERVESPDGSATETMQCQLTGDFRRFDPAADDWVDCPECSPDQPFVHGPLDPECSWISDYWLHKDPEGPPVFGNNLRIEVASSGQVFATSTYPAEPLVCE